jgi:H+-transporting ATPase
VDAAIRAAAAERGAPAPAVARFTPFDPAAKMAEALVAGADGAPLRIAKGSPIAITALAPLTPASRAAAAQLASEGCRVLAVAAGPPEATALIGLIGLGDPPRPDSAPLLNELREWASAQS